jgi:hypothetical protein
MNVASGQSVQSQRPKHRAKAQEGIQLDEARGHFEPSSFPISSSKLNSDQLLKLNEGCDGHSQSAARLQAYLKIGTKH